jgi:protein TonB
MFDTSLVRSRTIAAPRRFGLFTASVAIHTAVALGAIAMSIASVDFPDQSPDQMELYRPMMPVSLPAELGPGGPPKPQPKPQVTPAPPREPQPQEVTAPQEIPDETPVLSTPGAGADVIPTGGESGTGESGGGDPLGIPGGIGNDPGVGVGTPGDAGPLVPGGEVRAAKVLRRVEPRYPAAFVPARKTAVVTVRCVIDRNGRIRDPQVITSSWAPFNQSVIDAVQQWTFAPGTLRGEPVDTWFELTVRFEVR